MMRTGKLRHLPQRVEYDFPNVPRYGGTAAVATSASADGVVIALGLHSVSLSVEDTRRLADYLMEASDLVERGQASRTQEQLPPLPPRRT
jgi:hypothetical protein